VKSASRTTPTARLCLALLLLTAIPSVAASQEFQAGSARVDITPPPGLPTAGHGPIGTVARGHLTRLYTRAIFLRDRKGHALLLVSVEAFAVPQVFRSKVQQRFREQTGVDLPLASIIIAATHTHHGPGNFFSAAVYNHHGSALSGYVSDLREFLIDQIVSAAFTAYTKAQSSKSVRLQTRQAVLPVYSLRNRSPETFMLNRNAKSIMDDFDKRLRELGETPSSGDEDSCVKAQQKREQDGGWDIVGCPRLRAVDREMTILDVEDSSVRVATLVFGAVHPTVAQPDMPLFSSDFVGLAMRRLELDSGGSLVAAFFNGAEGDIAARRIGRDIRDIWMHASWMRQAIDGAKDIKPLDLSSGIESRMHFAAPGEILTGTPELRLAAEPRAGTAAFGGGEGDRTALYQLGWQERVTSFRSDDVHGAKLNPLKSRLLPSLIDLTFLLATSFDFPNALPLGYTRLGNFEIVSTPTEMSTATGYAIRKALRGSNPVVIIGLANEYASYTATADEYARQDYMAASTLWGAQESTFFVRALSMLKAGKPLPREGNPRDLPGFPSFALDPFDVGARRQAVDEDLYLLLRDGKRNPVRDLPYFTWSDREETKTYEDVTKTYVAIEQENGTLVEDDSAGRLVVLVLEKPKDNVREWAAIWLASLDDTTGKKVSVVFTVKTATGKCYKSQPFDIAIDGGDRGSREVTCAQAGSRP
jgi:neutral ceramidase